MVIEIELFELAELIPLYFCLWGWMESEVYKRKVDTEDKLLARILDAAARLTLYGTTSTSTAGLN